ncbi:MAG: CBS domain-containing protein [Tepidiphilus sp.]|nr:CBS domain-containing protein [Tepidiphilus sp.]
MNMFSSWKPLRRFRLVPGTTIDQPNEEAARQVTLESPAIEVMTDLERVHPATAHPDESLVTAEERMIRRGVRLLFVLDPSGTLSGILTANDLLGEKPMRFAHESHLKREEVLVRHIMTPFAQVDAILLEDILHAKVGNVVATLQECGRHHLLVAQQRDGRVSIRGIFSVTQIARQLGTEIPIDPRAQTFAEIESELR